MTNRSLLTGRPAGTANGRARHAFRLLIRLGARIFESVSLNGGKYVVRFTATGKDAKFTGHMVGVAAISLIRK